MILEDKYTKYKTIYLNKFIKTGDTLSDKGTYTPKSYIDSNMDSIPDGTINLAELMQWVYVCNLNNKYIPEVSIDDCLDTLLRLEQSAYDIYKDLMPKLCPCLGFFVRDDSTDEGRTDYKTLMNCECFEDPCHSQFVSQDQIWNLNPILKAIAMSKLYDKETTLLAQHIGYNINSYVKDNGYVLYNPYLSQYVHYITYLPKFKQSLSKRIEERDKNYKPTIKVKRGAYNWYYSGGTKSCVDAFMRSNKTYKGCLRTWLYKLTTFTIDKLYEPLLGLFGKEFKHNAINCYAATSGIWYNKHFANSRAKKTNKWLKTKNDFYNWNTDFLAGNLLKIDWELVKKWLDEYPEPIDIETTTNYRMNSPIKFLCIYEWYQYYLNNIKV